MSKVQSTWVGPPNKGGSAVDERAGLQEPMTSEGPVEDVVQADSTTSDVMMQSDDALDGIDNEEQGHQCNDPIVVTEADPPMEVAYERDGLIHHPYLDAINLVVDPQLKALCCLLCQVALIRNEALAHLHNQHKGLQVDMEQFRQVVTQLDVADDFPEPYFTQVISPFRGLEVLTGIGCGHCAYATSSSKCMQVHHREHHRDTATPKDWTACKMQRFSRSGKGRVLFQVHDTAAPACPVPVDDAISHLRQQMAQASTSNMPQDERVISPWLRTTRWHEHVTGHDVCMLRDLVEIPRCDDDGLFPGLKAAVRQYFNEALDLLTITDELVLQRLNSPAPLKEGISNTPFHRHQNEDTMDTYTAPVIALLYMLGRVQQENRYSLPLPDSLIAKVTALGPAIREGVDVSASLHQVLTEVWMTKWPKTTGNPMPCPTERMLALYTLEGDGKHKEPAAVTYYLARLTYCIRLVCLKELRQQSESRFNGVEELACDELQPWFTEHTNSPFSRIRALQHRASSLAFQTMSLPRIWWTDNKQWTELLYKGHRVHLKDLHTMFAASATSIAGLWEHKVLRGIKIRVSYASLADDLGNHDVGYSFLTDRRNTCFADRDALSNKFINDPSLAGHFGVWRDGRMIWDKGALQQWLNDYAEFQGELLLCCETLSGAPGRGTELTPLTFCNTRERTQRNVVILGQHVALLRCYHKSAAMTGQEKLIPHALDALTADLVIQSLALARPFAELAAYLCYPHRPEVLQHYQSQLFVNHERLFTTDNISNCMAKLSLQHLPLKLTVNPNNLNRLPSSSLESAYYKRKFEKAPTIYGNCTTHR
ncbi:hypothetical protein BKA82DRAFT_36655 [Pisolithus tinctorius]|uniref:C2H2-type domain-containing protein n=1 Tax=Pisolithus tinctorius Marx 270 TaxID=870435 RepID=A0A0C3I6Q7_PISTI|nr:hypothetical protein BKA82DRAFT_36655 [Pisolithus tinctorius]KIN92862.1 hypothetical protein M404DRAFT_36655 [Pisolithus tinctorius Marx 270]